MTTPTRPWYTIRNAAAPTAAELYLYGDIGRDPWTGEGIDAAAFAQDLAAIKASHLDIHIHSQGGNVWDGAAIVAAIDRHPATKTVYVDGIAASMASQIMMVAQERVISPLGTVMIHLPWTVTAGNADDMAHTADRLRRLEGPMIAMYQRGMTASAEEIRQALADTTWYNAQDALDAGLVTAIGEAVDGIAALGVAPNLYQAAPTYARRYLEVSHVRPPVNRPPASPEDTPTPTDLHTPDTAGNHQHPKRGPVMSILSFLKGLGHKPADGETDEQAQARLNSLMAHYGDDTTAISAHFDAGRDLTAALAHDCAELRAAMEATAAEADRQKQDAEAARAELATATADKAQLEQQLADSEAARAKLADQIKTAPPVSVSGDQDQGTPEEQWEADETLQRQFHSAEAYAAYVRSQEKRRRAGKED